MDEMDLPKPPVPKLSITIQRFLNGLEAILPTEEFSQIQVLTKDFEKPEGIGTKLQTLLKEYAEEKENYVTEIWLDNTYLKNRLPLPIYSSPFLLLPKQEFETDNDRLSYIAKFIIFSLIFKQKVDSGKMSLKYVMDQTGKIPLSTTTYRHFFTAYRRPAKNKDEHVFSENSRDILVASNNQFFILQLPEKSLPDEMALREKLKEIEDASEEGSYPEIGILTTDNREQWAAVREEMIKKETNKKAIQQIENSLFVVCMDQTNENMLINQKRRYSDCILENMAHQIFHGNKMLHSSANRWFDKFLQFIVTKNGVNGLCIEQSVSDEIAVLRFCEEFLDFLEKPQSKKMKSVGNLKIQKVEWQIEETSIKCDIQNSRHTFDTLVGQIDLNIFKFSEFGTRYIRSLKINPDIFIKLSLQLAYFRMTQNVTATQETIGLRKFRFGRIGYARFSPEALDFVKSILSSYQNKAEKREKFRKAVNSQTDILTYTMNGEDPDNHLLCLREIAALNDIKEPYLFKIESFKKYMNFRLATYHVPNKRNIIVGYGPTVPEGYGCCYIPEDGHITFCITSFFNEKTTDSNDFAKNIHQSLLNIKEIAVGPTAAASSSQRRKVAVQTTTQ